MAILESEILDKVGKYNLTQLDIISYQQQKDESAPKVMDIKGIADIINLHEDILTHTLYGTVTVYDTQDIRSIFPLTGLERLSLKFNTPGCPGYDYTEDNGTPFHIYKIDKITKIVDKDEDLMPLALNSIKKLEKLTSINKKISNETINNIKLLKDPS